MPIAFACPGCEKFYEVAEALAGKKGRCKQCATIFMVPDLAPSIVLPADALHDLDDGEPAPRFRSRPDDDFGADPLPRNPRPFGPAKKTSRKVDIEGQERYRQSGIALIIFGFLAIFLPMVGFQHRVLALLDPAWQRAAGILALVAGSGLIGISFASHPRRLMMFGSIGFLILAVSVVAAFIIFPHQAPNLNAMANDPAPNVPAPPPRLPIPRPAFRPPPQPPPWQPPRDVAAAPAELPFTISNAKAAQQPGLGGNPGRELAFRIEWESSGPVPTGGPLVWVIESARSNASRSFGGQGRGTMTTVVAVTEGDTGPFTTYIAREDGPSRVKVSNVLAMQWLGESGLGDISPLAPRARPFGPPGMPPPGFPRGPRFPRRP